MHNQLNKAFAHSANKTKTSRLTGEKKKRIFAQLLKDVLMSVDSAQSAKHLERSENLILRKDADEENFFFFL